MAQSKSFNDVKKIDTKTLFYIKPQKTLMPEYENGKIYKICSHQTEKVYVGSTTRPLSERLAQHKGHIKTQYCTSYEILKFNDAYIELIENWPCNNREELRQREGYYIRNHNCVNKHIIGRTLQEWRIDTGKYIPETCECGGKYTSTHKAEHLKSDLHLYFVENGKPLENKPEGYRKEHFECECGGTYLYTHKTRHYKSKKHQAFIEEKDRNIIDG